MYIHTNTYIHISVDGKYVLPIYWMQKIYSHHLYLYICTDIRHRAPREKAYGTKKPGALLHSLPGLPSSTYSS